LDFDTPYEVRIAPFDEMIGDDGWMIIVNGTHIADVISEQVDHSQDTLLRTSQVSNADSCVDLQESPPSQSSCDLPDSSEPFATMHPTSGEPGALVQVDGQDFTPGEVVSIIFGGYGEEQHVAAVTVDDDGTFTAKFEVPMVELAGEYPILAESAERRLFIDFFTVEELELPSATMTPTRGPVDTIVVVEGQNFNSDGKFVSITFGSQEIVAAFPDDSGAFSVSFNVPDLEAGKYTVLAGNLFIENFTIVAPEPIPYDPHNPSSASET
jgi:hypothetical protein